MEVDAVLIDIKVDAACVKAPAPSPGHKTPICIDMCINMCMDMCINMCIDMCIGV